MSHLEKKGGYLINNLQRKKNYFASYFLCFTFFINHLPLNALPKVTKSSVFKIKNKNKNKVIQLSIRRFQSEQGKPVILSHPLALSNLAMEKLGYALWQQGYDVWMPNTRGHGRKEERSIVHPYKRNDYGFDKIITESPDISHVNLYSWGEPLLHPHIDKIIDYVHEKNVAVAPPTGEGGVCQDGGLGDKNEYRQLHKDITYNFGGGPALGALCSADDRPAVRVFRGKGRTRTARPRPKT